MDLMSLNHTLKMVNFILHIFYHNKKNLNQNYIKKKSMDAGILFDVDRYGVEEVKLVLPSLYKIHHCGGPGTLIKAPALWSSSHCS